MYGKRHNDDENYNKNGRFNSMNEFAISGGECAVFHLPQMFIIITGKEKNW